MATDPIGAILEIAVGSTARIMLWITVVIASVTFGVGLLVGWMFWG